MVLPARTPPPPAEVIRGLDPGWAERLGAEADRYERRERRAGIRRAGLCLAAAAAVVALGLLGFRNQTATRSVVPRPAACAGCVTVTIPPPAASARAAGGP